MPATLLPHTVGRYRGFDIQGCPLRDVMPLAEANPFLWFAFGPDGDLVVAGVPTRRDLESALDAMVGPSPVVFRSVDRPELVLDEDDVSLCESCGDLSTRANEEAPREYGSCATCRDYRLVHGYGPGGIGLPVVLEDRERAAPAPQGTDAHLTFANNRRSPLPCPAA